MIFRSIDLHRLLNLQSDAVDDKRKKRFYFTKLLQNLKNVELRYETELQLLNK